MSNKDKKKNVKDTRLQFRFDSETLAQLDESAKIKNTTRSEIVRTGIKKVHSELKKWVDSHSPKLSTNSYHHTMQNKNAVLFASQSDNLV